MIILYYSRHGFTEKCARLLKESLGYGVELIPLGKGVFLNPAPEEPVVLGFPIYQGKIPGIVRNFLTRNGKTLLARPLGLFVSALSSRKTAEAYLQKQLDPEIQNHIRVKGYFGGALEWKKLSFLEKLMLKNLKGLQGDVSNLDLTEIQKMAEDLQKIQDPIDQTNPPRG